MIWKMIKVNLVLWVWGSTCYFLSECIFKTEGKNDIEKYRFYEWGVFELFLAAVSKMYASQLINLFVLVKLEK